MELNNYCAYCANIPPSEHDLARDAVQEEEAVALAGECSGERGTACCWANDRWILNKAHAIDHIRVA